MATTPSSINHFRTSSPAARVEPGNLITTVTPRRPVLVPIRSTSSRISTPISMPKEPEDALLTGGTRSLDRRLLGLNLLGSLTVRKAAPERVIPARQPAVA
jgi:hypothetical protein